MRQPTKSSMITLIGTALFAGLMTTVALASDAYGDPFEGWGFVNQDWQVVCDNTLTCRVAGYMPESEYDMPVSILITAEPMQSKVKAGLKFYLESEDDLNLDTPTLWLNDKNYGAIGSEFILNTQQTNALLALARKNTKIEIKAGSNVWQISDKGMASVLLKLDEVQGRVGTSLALVSKDNPKRHTPKKGRPKPVIKRASYYPETDNKTLDTKTLTFFKKNITTWIDSDSDLYMGDENVMGDCEFINPDNESTQNMMQNEYSSSIFNWKFTPIDSQHTLASHVCWTGAYNRGYGYWLINNNKPSSPKLITTSGAYYEDGEIWAIHKDRGLGDCWNRAIWIWDGSTFALSEKSTTGLCRGFAGGTWDLPTFVSEVIDSKVDFK